MPSLSRLNLLAAGISELNTICGACRAIDMVSAIKRWAAFEWYGWVVYCDIFMKCDARVRCGSFGAIQDNDIFGGLVTLWIGRSPIMLIEAEVLVFVFWPRQELGEAYFVDSHTLEYFLECSMACSEKDIKGIEVSTLLFELVRICSPRSFLSVLTIELKYPRKSHYINSSAWVQLSHLVKPTMIIGAVD